MNTERNFSLNYPLHYFRFLVQYSTVPRSRPDHILVVECREVVAELEFLSLYSSPVVGSLEFQSNDLVFRDPSCWYGNKPVWQKSNVYELGKKPYLDSMGIGITKCDKKDYNVWQIGPLQSVTRIGFKYNNCRIKKFDKMDYKVQQWLHSVTKWNTKPERDCKLCKRDHKLCQVGALQSVTRLVN